MNSSGFDVVGGQWILANWHCKSSNQSTTRAPGNISFFSLLGIYVGRTKFVWRYLHFGWWVTKKLSHFRCGFRNCDFTCMCCRLLLIPIWSTWTHCFWYSCPLYWQ